MKLVEKAERTPLLLEQLLAVWERSVKTTHLFLSEPEIEKLRPCALQALKEVSHLVVAENEAGQPIAFLGVEERQLEMLFCPRSGGRGSEKRFCSMESNSMRSTS